MASVRALSWPLALILLAGCASAPTQPESTARDPTMGAVARFTDDTGGIEGHVVDDSLVPVEGAEVILIGPGEVALTEVSGSFAFSNLPPGAYEVQASKAGFEPGARPIRVLAGEVTRVQVVLVALPEELPHVTTTFFDGFWTCWLGLIFASPLCDGIGGTDVSWGNMPLEGNASALLGELVWQKTTSVTSPAQARLYLFAQNAQRSSAQYGTSGTSPVRLLVQPGDKSQSSSGATMEPNATQVQWQANPGGAWTVSPHESLITYQQRFRVYVSAFYHTSHEGFSAIPDS